MTNYRIGCILLVISSWCLAVAVGTGARFYMILSTIAVLLAGQIYARGCEDAGKLAQRKR